MHYSLLVPVLTGLFSVLATAATPTCTYAKAAPTPAGYTCEVQGSLKTPKILYTISPLPSLQSCWQHCINEPTCLDYGYNPSSKVCTFYTKTLAAQGFTKGNTGVTFAARNCYTCGCAAGLGKCGQNCLNLQTDSSNCGKCGNVCSKGTICLRGTCSCQNPGFLWQVATPNTPVTGNYLTYVRSAILTAVSDRSQAIPFVFNGTAVTSAVQYNGSSIPVIVTVANSANPADPENTPTATNQDGTPVYVSAVGLDTIPIKPDDQETAVNCTATPNRQLSCQNFGTLNKLQVCPHQQDQNSAPVYSLYIGDHYLNTTELPNCSAPVAIDLVCP